MHRAAGGGHVRAEALVVFHVTRRQLFGCGVVKLGEQIGGQFAHGVHQHVQATAVSHADHHFLHTLGTCQLNQFVHGGNKAFTALQGEALLAHVLGVQIALQALGGAQAVEDVFFLFGAEGGFAADAFQFLLPPTLLRHVGGVHVLGAQGAAIGFAQGIDQFAQAHAVFAEESVAGVEHGFLVGVAKAVKGRLELGDVGAVDALQRVQVGPALPDVAVSGDQLLRGGAFAAHFGVGAGHDDAGTALLGAFGKGVDHGQVRHVFGVAAVHGGNVLKRIEVLTPAVGDAAGVGEVVFVHLFNVGSVAPEEIGVACVSLIDGRTRLR